MAFCRYCGREIDYKYTKNEKYLPCDALTGQPHFCRSDKSEYKNQNTGLLVCQTCGKPVFNSKEGRKNVLMDYTTLTLHICEKRNITNYQKYKKNHKN